MVAVATSLAASVAAFEESAEYIQLGLALASAVAGGVVFYQIWRASKRLEEVCALCEDLAAGDFSRRIDDVRDGGVIYKMMWAVNGLADYVDAYIRESTAVLGYVSRNQYFRRILEGGMRGDLLNGARTINKATEQVAAKMEGFKDIAAQVDTALKGVVTDISDTSGRLSDAASQMGSTVVSTRAGASAAIDATGLTSQNVQAISAAAEQMSISIAEISQQMSRTNSIANQAVDEARVARESIVALVDMAKRIDEVVTAIDSIAGQTNLLALNATIEAARAGDAGKGFTIVASEVKDLAAQTTSATEDIARQIGEIQKATSKAEQSFEAIDRIIHDIHEASTVVAAAVEEQTAASKEIASNVERAASGTVEMSQKVETIGRDIQDVEGAANSVQAATTHLSGDTTQNVHQLLDKMTDFVVELRRVG